MLSVTFPPLAVISEQLRECYTVTLGARCTFVVEYKEDNSQLPSLGLTSLCHSPRIRASSLIQGCSAEDTAVLY